MKCSRSKFLVDNHFFVWAYRLDIVFSSPSPLLGQRGSAIVHSVVHAVPTDNRWSRKAKWVEGTRGLARGTEFPSGSGVRSAVHSVKGVRCRRFVGTCPTRETIGRAFGNPEGLESFGSLVTRGFRLIATKMLEPVARHEPPAHEHRPGREVSLRRA